MCGIAGIFSPAEPLPVRASETVREMTRALSHRGPDDEGYFADQHAALGHRRLSIIDLASGHQPMAGSNGRNMLVFNGEIYNFKELRSELEKAGYPFRTRSDTEVILAGYEKWGQDVVRRLKGMFAFVLYDPTENSILAARDPIGKKPFYYSLAPHGVLYFASELGAIAASRALDGKVSEEALQLYFSLGYIPAPHSIYNSVRKLPAGHALTCSPRGMKVFSYWDINLHGTEGRDENLFLEQLESLLDKAVSRRLVADVPVGALLSGGIDSNLVVSTMAKRSQDAVRTYTAGFAGKAELTGAGDERASADKAAKAYGTRHESIMVDDSTASLLERLVPYIGEPFADSSIVPTYLVCRAARRKVTVALTGDGGDEPFGGYSFRYLPHLFENRLRKHIPASLLRSTCGVLSGVWPRSSRLPKYLRLSTIFRNLATTREAAFFLDQSISADGHLPVLVGNGKPHEPALQLVSDLYRKTAGRDELTRILYVDARLYMTEDVLVKADRMSMANSLELRSPLLDQDIVQFAFSLPGEMKINGRECKYLLKRLARSRVAPHIMNQPKTGFSIPIENYLRGQWKMLFDDSVFDAGTPLKDWIGMSQVRYLWNRFLSGDNRHLQFLWAVLMLALWYREFHRKQSFS